MCGAVTGAIYDWTRRGDGHMPPPRFALGEFPLPPEAFSAIVQEEV